MADSHVVSTDRVLLTALVVAVFAYAALWPRDIYLFDEGYFLYESLRILRGDVLYRDFFEINAPLSFYAMAACLKLFGVSLFTARAATAALQAVIVTTIFRAARGLGVRGGLAVVAGLVHLAAAYMLVSIASPHWFGAALSTLLVAMVLSPRWRRRTGWLGAEVGCLIATQHQKGLLLGAGVGVAIVLDSALVRWYGLPPDALPRALGRFAVGVAAVAVPIFGGLAAAAGAAPAFDALVRFPLGPYRAYHRHQVWGLHPPIPYGDLPGRLVIWLPWLTPLPLASGALAALRRQDPGFARSRLLLGLLAGVGVLAVVYNPDTTHLVTIAPIGLLIAAERLEAALGWAERRRWPRLLGPALVGALTAGVVAQLAFELRLQRAAFPIRAETPLGPVDFADHNEPMLLDVLRERLRDEPVREVFGYPFYASLYLLVDARNATRFQALKPGYSTPEQFAEAIQALETRRTPYVVVLPFWINWNNDPMMDYLRAHYARVAVPHDGSPYPPFALFHRVR